MEAPAVAKDERLKGFAQKVQAENGAFGQRALGAQDMSDNAMWTLRLNAASQPTSSYYSASSLV